MNDLFDTNRKLTTDDMPPDVRKKLLNARDAGRCARCGGEAEPNAWWCTDCRDHLGGTQG